MGRVPRRWLAASLVLAALALPACSPPAEPGWSRLWHAEWEWSHRGERWVRGVAADGRVVEAPARGMRLRAELANLGESDATVSWGDDAAAQRLAPGESRRLELGLERGAALRFTAPVGVVLGEPRVGRPLDRPRLVVFVLVDTLRADHATRELMPTTAKFFADGRRWRRATANASWTLPSVASFFSSRPVLELTAPTGDLIGLPEGVASWAGALETAGFSGAAVVANYSVAVLNGFGTGFSSYLVPDGHGGDPHPDASWVVDGATAWLATHRGENAFLYLHLMDPHHPYRAHGEPEIEVPDLIPLAMRRQRAGAEETALLRRLYAGEVAHVDQVLGPFLAALPDDAVVVLTADHGEGLGEHDCWGHGLNLYQESLVVPLMIRGPGVAPGEVDQVVELLDLAPTVLGLAGVAPPPEMAGRSLLDGGSGHPVVSSTFGAGPLRWAWRERDRKVVLRMAPQPGVGVEARSKMEEGSPLPSGAFFFELDRDPHEDEPVPVPEELWPELGASFAATAGRMVPGLQLLAWRPGAGLELELQLDPSAEVVQAWSTAPIGLRRDGPILQLRSSGASPVCAVALAAPATTGGRLLSSSVPARPVVGEAFVAGELALPEAVPGELRFGWSPERSLVVRGHEETLERLRALGYIR